MRTLRSFRDFYVKSITRCAGSVRYEGAAYNPTLSEFSHSYSFSSNRMRDCENDLGELVQAATMANEGSAKKEKRVKRSQSVVIGRIDEDEACEFEEEDVKVGSSLLVPRRRSLDVGGLGPRPSVG